VDTRRLFVVLYFVGLAGFAVWAGGLYLEARAEYQQLKQLQAAAENTVVMNSLRATRSVGTAPGSRCSSVVDVSTPANALRRPGLTLASVAVSLLALIAGRKRAR
jgi:hypothetical protein